MSFEPSILQKASLFAVITKKYNTFEYCNTISISKTKSMFLYYNFIRGKVWCSWEMYHLPLCYSYVLLKGFKTKTLQVLCGLSPIFTDIMFLKFIYHSISFVMFNRDLRSSFDMRRFFVTYKVEKYSRWNVISIVTIIIIYEILLHKTLKCT